MPTSAFAESPTISIEESAAAAIEESAAAAAEEAPEDAEEAETNAADPTISMKDQSVTYTGEKIRFPNAGITIDGMSASDTVHYYYSNNISSGATPVFTENAYPTYCGRYRVYATITDKNGTKLADSGNATSFVIVPKSVTIEAATNEKPYDGTPLRDSTYILRSELGKGDTLGNVTVVGTQTPVGSIPNKITGATVLKGANDVTSNYSLTFVDGKLTVTEKTTTVTLKDKTAEYTASPIAIEPATVTGSSAAPVYHYYSDKDLKKEISGPPTDAGTYYVKAKVAADPQYGAGENAPAATLTIIPRNATITADDATKTWDGEPLTSDQWHATGVLAGQEIKSVTVVGSQTDVGSSNNTPSVAIIEDANGNDVTKNYQFTPKGGTPGTLKVTPNVPTVTLKPKTETYNGKQIEIDPATVNVPDKGDSIDAKDIVYKYYKDADCKTPVDTTNPSAAPTNVGVYYVTATTPESKNYDSVTSDPVTLTINPIELAIKTGDKTEKDNGKPLTYNYYSYTDNVLAKGDAITNIDITGKQVGVGTSKNTAETNSVVIKNEAGTDVTKNYKITITEGDLTLTPASGTPTPAPSSVPTPAPSDFPISVPTSTPVVPPHRNL